MRIKTSFDIKLNAMRWLLRCICVALILLPIYAANAQTPSTIERSLDARTVTEIQTDINLSPPSFASFVPSIVHLTANDTIHKSLFLRTNFTDPLLEDSETGNLIPASRILGVEHGTNFYRTGQVDERTWLLAQKHVTGKMSLYYARNLYPWNGELEMISMNGNEDTYRNFMIAETPDGRHFAKDYSYFITLAHDTTRLIKIDQATFAGEYLSQTPKAFRKFQGMQKRNKWISKVAVPLLTVSSMLLIGSANNGNLDFSQPGMQYISFAITVSAAALVVQSIRNRGRRYNPEGVEEVMDLYNAYHK